MQRSAGLTPLILLAIVGACGSSPAPSESGVAASVNADGSGGIDGFELVRVSDAVEIEAASPDGAVIRAPADTLLVRVVDDGDEDRALVATVGPGPWSLGWIGHADAEMARLECPREEISVAVLYRLGPLAALCSSGASFSFTAFVPGLCGAGGFVTTGTPDWLNGASSGVALYHERVAPENAVEPPPSGWIAARAAPGVDVANCGSASANRLNVITAHYDDPAASQCRTAWIAPDGSGTVEEAPEVSIARCRLTLVIEAVQELIEP